MLCIYGFCQEWQSKLNKLCYALVLQLRKSGDGEDGVEVIKETYETNQVTEEFGKTNFDVSEKEALLKEIAELKGKLQPTKSADNLRSSLLLRSIQMRKSIDVTRNGENSDVIEKEREMWTDMESEWISLTDDLRMDIDNHRSRAESLEIELNQEKLATEELNDALTRAVLGHSRFIEQYTELQEKYNELGEKHSVMIAGITDVKKAASKAAMNGRHGKRFAKAFSAELSAIRAEKEKERELLKKENKSLRTQLRDTAEAVQAAGELLVRLRESEQALQVSEVTKPNSYLSVDTGRQNKNFSSGSCLENLVLLKISTLIQTIIAGTIQRGGRRERKAEEANGAAKEQTQDRNRDNEAILS